MLECNFATSPPVTARATSTADRPWLVPPRAERRCGRRPPNDRYRPAEFGFPRVNMTSDDTLPEHNRFTELPPQCQGTPVRPERLSAPRPSRPRRFGGWWFRGLREGRTFEH